MKAKEMLELIVYIEKNYHGLNRWSLERAKYFQRKKISEQIDIELDSSFYDFLKFLSDLYGCNVHISTAKRILNNAYIWARDNARALQKVEPFKSSRNEFDFILKNISRIDHAAFAKGASQEVIDILKNKIPKNSKLANEMLSAVNKEYSGSGGFTYNYFIKVVAGFLECI